MAIGVAIGIEGFLYHGGAWLAGRVKRKKATPPPLKGVDEEITALFQQWLIAFEKTQSAKDDEESATALARIESRIAATPAEGLRGLW